MVIGDLLLLLLMWGISISVWQKSDINFIKLLNLEGTELEYLKHPELLVYKTVTNFSIIFLILFIFFNKIKRGIFPLLFKMKDDMIIAHIISIGMLGYFFYHIIYPINKRKKWWTMLYLVLTAPLHPVSFCDGYIGDILTSLVKVFLPLCFSFAYILLSTYAIFVNDKKTIFSESDLWWYHSIYYRNVIEPFIVLLPLWLRLMQCLRRSVETGSRYPYFLNAFKYASAISIISYGVFQPNLRYNIIWIILFVIVTLYQFVWDIVMDWGLVIRNNHYNSRIDYFTNYFMIRKIKLLGSEYVYYIVIFCNFILRFAWALTLLPEIDIQENKSLYSLVLFHLGPLIAAVEVNCFPFLKKMSSFFLSFFLCFLCSFCFFYFLSFFPFFLVFFLFSMFYFVFMFYAYIFIFIIYVIFIYFLFLFTYVSV